MPVSLALQISKIMKRIFSEKLNELLHGKDLPNDTKYNKFDHGMTRHKLRCCDINRKLGELLHDFLNILSQTVVTNGSTAKETQILRTIS